MAELGRTFEARIASIIGTASTIGPMVDDLRLFWASHKDLTRIDHVLPVDDPDLPPAPARAEPAEEETPELAALKAALLSELDQLPHCNERAERVLGQLDHKLAEVAAWLDKEVAHIRGHHETVQTKYAELEEYEAKRGAYKGPLGKKAQKVLDKQGA